ncbi:MAG: DUF4160 domain-containing protein [Spirochaetia bacterium]|nr:DUF4160 domain-containing protein [Spirochaetia bacterium]
MPKIFEWNGYKFFFFSNEGEPLEPAHVHVRKSGNLAKFWLMPDVKLSESWGFNSKELKQLLEKVKENKTFMMEKWNEYFNI